MPSGIGLAQIWIDVGLDTHAINRDLSKTRRAFEQTTKKIQARMRTFAVNMKRLWFVALAGFAALVASSGMAISAFASLENAQVELQKRMDITEESFEALNKQLALMSTTMPTTRKELTEIAAAAAKVGVSRANIAQYATVMKKFEIATEMAADEAAIVFKRILNVTGQTIDVVENLGSALARLLDEFPTADVETIVQVMQKMGRSLGALGVRAQDLAALGTAVSSIAQRAARPASQLRKLFVEMAEQPEKFAEAVGVSAQEVATAIQEDPIDAVMKFISTLKQLYGNQTALLVSSLEEISRTSAKAILPLIANYDLLVDALATSRDEFAKNERLQEEYRMEMKKLSTQLRVSWGNVQTFAQTLGSTLGDTVRRFNQQYLKPLTSNLVEVVINSEDARKAIARFIKTGLKITGLATLVGLLAKMFAFLISPVGFAIVTMVALFAGWEYNILGVRDALQDLGKAWQQLIDLDISGLSKTLTEAFKEHPVPTVITLSIIGFAIGKLFGLSLIAMLAAPFVNSFKLFSWGAKAGGIMSATLTGVGIVLALAGLAFASWEKVKVSTKSFGQQLAEHIMAGAAGGLLAAMGGTLLGIPLMGSFGLGIVGAIVVLELTKLIPKINLGKTRETQEEIKKAKEKLEQQVKTLGIEVHLNLKPKMVKENLGKIENELEKAVKNINKLTEKQLQELRKTINMISKLGAKPGVFIPRDLARVAQRLDNLLSERGHQKGGPASFQFGGFVPGAGSGDIIPAMLEPGEFVWSKEMVQRFPGLIKGLWQRFRKGGPVSSGKHYYGPGPDDEKLPAEFGYLESFKRKLEQVKDTLGNYIEGEKYLKKFNQDMDSLIGGVDALINGIAAGNEIIEQANEKRKQIENELANRASFLQSLWGKLAVEMKQITKIIEGLKIGELAAKLPTLWKQITMKEITKGIPAGALRGTAGGLPERVFERRKMTYPVAKTLSAFDSKLKESLEELFNLRNLLSDYGLSTASVTARIEKLKQSLIEAGVPRERLTEIVKELTQGMSQLKKVVNKVTTVTSGLRGIFQAANVEIPPVLDGLISAIDMGGQAILSFSQGNWIQGAMQAGQAIASIFGGIKRQLEKRLEDLKEQRRKARERMDTAVNVIIQSLEGLANTIESLTRSIIGPFSSALSGLLDGFINLFRMTAQIDNTAQLMRSGLEAVFSITQGVIDSFISLISKSDAYGQLQDELNSLWKALGDALGELVMPLIALARWIKEYLGISDDLTDDAREIVELNVPAGFKTARKIWEAATGEEPAQMVGGGAVEVPQWAKDIIQPIKDALIPVLDDIKSINIAAWAQQVWTFLSQLVTQQIPKVWGWIKQVVAWLSQKGGPMLNRLFTILNSLWGWFEKNFPKAWDKFWKNLKKFLSGEFITNLAQKIAALTTEIEETKKTIRKTGAAGIGAGVGGAIGAGIGTAIAPGIGTAIGAGAGALLGGIAGWFIGQEGGILTKPAIGLAGEAGPEALLPLGKIEPIIQSAMRPMIAPITPPGAGAMPGGGSLIIENHLSLDGKEIYQNQKKYKSSEMYRNTGSTSGGGYGRDS